MNLVENKSTFMKKDPTYYKMIPGVAKKWVGMNGGGEITMPK